MAADVYIAFGSNVGDRERNLTDALQAIARKMPIIGASSIYETEPWGLTKQRNFWNAVVAAQWDGEPVELLAFLESVEIAHGRKEKGTGAPRTIDLDILLFGARVIRRLDLVIPHRYLEMRDFFLVPLLEIAPETAHPATRIRLSEYMRRLPPQLKTIVAKKESALWLDTTTSLSRDR